MNNEGKLQEKRGIYEFIKKQNDLGLLDKSTVNKWAALGINVEPKPKEKLTSTVKKATGQLSIDKDIYNWYKDNNVYDNRYWKPKSVIFHDDDFWQWINSITFGFVHQKIYYKPFEIYKAQAQYYVDNARNPYDTDNLELKREIIMEEYAKIDCNTLYFANKYSKVKEGSSRSGKIDYVSKEHNAIIFFLLDCGYSFIFGKPRQIFATTTIGIYINKKLITQENFYMKFITEDDKTGMEILDDKVKTAYGFLPVWMRPQVSRDYIKGFRLGKKLDKGEYALPNSRIEVVPPSKTAVNGGSPQIVFVDEVGNVPDLIPMVLEARPTMYIDKNQDGDLQIVRQLCLWGTGVSDNRGKNAFQSLWTNTLDFWERKDFKSAIFVPLFFSWHARCGQEVYDSELKSYTNGERKEFDGMSSDEQLSIFHMHYPSHWRDMFAMASNKLVPRKVIEDNLTRIRNMAVKDRPIPGVFEPIYDYTTPYDDNIGVPYRIIGAKFIPQDDFLGDEFIPSVFMQSKPERGWKNRYYKGTDPIMTDAGNSLFASTVWDRVKLEPACIMNYRKSYDPKAAYVQSLLMALYYDTENEILPIGCPELVENNIGTNYVDYCQLLGYGKNLVYNAELQPELRGGNAMWGINTKAHRKQVAVSKLNECIMTYNGNINNAAVFNQLDTYVPVVKATGISYEPVDKRLYHDDILDSIAFAYICAQTYSHRNPEKVDKEAKEFSKPKTRLLRDKNGMLYRDYVR